MNLERLRSTIKRHEGLRLAPYPDSLGNWTVGYGHLLKHVGPGEPASITSEQAERWFDEDCADALDAARGVCPSFDSLTDARREVLINMAFNLGAWKLAKFRDTLAAVARKAWNQAAAEMLNSPWAVQVGARADELAGMMRVG